MTLDILIQIIASGLTLGAMYAVSTVGLSLVWGSLGMLNMAHGGLMAFGSYAAYYAMNALGLPLLPALLAAILVGAALGAIIYHGAVQLMLRQKAFETNVVIATVGLAFVLENAILKLFGAHAQRQPLQVEGAIAVGSVVIPLQNILILGAALILMLTVAMLLQKSRIGRAIRATAMNREAAQLMGVRVGQIYAVVLMLAGALAAISGVMISSLTGLSPGMGADPMLKAFIICVVAGLGNVYGAVASALALGLIESLSQFVLGVRFGFATLLLIVIVVLIWRPNGLFGRQQVTRL
ncbi:MAG TPA: branched-chain amino acid ABC transporter permease [Kiloniellales bacterium]|nr:branched-chain amino acid ABC transporter permease [Kiloniellales bacterium]